MEFREGLVWEHSHCYSSSTPMPDLVWCDQPEARESLTVCTVSISEETSPRPSSLPLKLSEQHLDSCLIARWCTHPCKQWPTATKVRYNDMQECSFCVTYVRYKKNSPRKRESSCRCQETPSECSKSMPQQGYLALLKFDQVKCVFSPALSAMDPTCLPLGEQEQQV